MKTPDNANNPAPEAGTSHPDELMREVSKSTMGRTLPISIAVHAVLIAITSIPFIAECVEYGTMFPTEKKLRLAKEEKAKQRQARREAIKKKLAAKAKAGRKGEGRAPTTRQAPAAVRGTSPVERRVTEVITTQPKATIDLGEDLE